MRWRTTLLAAALVLGIGAAPVPEITLWRMDCGTFVTKGLTDSCYLIRHGRQLMLWDTGLGTELIGHPKTDAAGSVVLVTESLVAELARIGIEPDQIDIVALSHMHGDHISQAASFPHAKLLIGRQDWEALTATTPAPHLEPDRLAPWIKGGAPKELIDGDKDVFGDGTVMMIATPGHTAGHHALLVRLKKLGPVMLTGDLYNATEQYRQKLMPKHNADTDQTRASFRRFDEIASAEKALVIIQHERNDIAKLPLFPQPAN
jgi:glyoxylase-like metal-dependent hydrolase (beta-lactamase superfamily II)